jgi:demethylmenaquinone methyltransferase/2-methoxy-6-polyprenyl-1,4-benzoquinol methylase
MATMAIENPTYTKQESWKMFNRISGRYDFLNRFLSFGLDIIWRKKLVNFLPKKDDLKILDLATGTGDVLIYLLRNSKLISKAYGIDMAEGMLTIGKEKIEKNGLNEKITLQLGDINQVSFEGNMFDCTTIAFGIRNVEDPKQVLNEMFRVLKENGKALILEFSLPQSPILKTVYLLYMRYILPVLGAVISGDFKAYKYLNQTVEKFPYGEEFCALMKEAGFKNVKANPLTFGVATIYEGDKN